MIPFNFCSSIVMSLSFLIWFFGSRLCFLVNLATGLINFYSFIRNQYWEFIYLFLLLFFCYPFHRFLLWSLLFSSLQFSLVWFAFLFLVSFLFLIFIYLFWLHQVLVAAHRMFDLCCGIGLLVVACGIPHRIPSSLTRERTQAPALWVQSLSHWTTREVPPLGLSSFLV